MKTLTDFLELKFLIPLLLSLYAAALATYTFYVDRAGRLKITYEFCPNFIIGSDLVTQMYHFNIVNLGPKKRIITHAGYQFDQADKTVYSPFERFVGPETIEFGEQVIFQVHYNDFNNLFDRTDAKKFRLRVEDSTGKVYQTKWIRFERFTKSTGSLKEITPAHNSSSP